MVQIHPMEQFDLIEIEKKLSETKDTAIRIPLLMVLSRHMADYGEFARGLAWAEEAEQLARELADLPALAEALSLKGLHYRLLADYPRAAANAQQAIALFTSLNDGRSQLGALCEFSYTQLERGHYLEALDLLVRAQDLLSEDTLAIEEANLWYHFGMAYVRLRDAPQAKSYLERALRLAREVNSPILLASILNGISVLEFGFEPPAGSSDEHTKPFYQRALQYQEEALSLAQAVGAQPLIMRVLGNIAVVRSALGETEQALELYQQQLTGVRQMGQRQSEAICLSNIGELSRYLGRHDDSVRYLQEALYIANEIGSKRRASYAHQELSKTFEAMGDLLRAFSHYKLYHILEQEMFNDETKRKANTLALRQEVERGQKETEYHRLHSAELESANHLLAEQAKLLERQAREDSLTGLANRRYLEQYLAELFRRTKAQGGNFSIAIIDIDNFKLVNDCFSHQMGDEVLRIVAQILKQHCRAGDFIARYGGDECVVVLTDIALAQTQEICERIRCAIEGYDWAHLHTKLTVTVSIGLSDDLAVQNHEELLTLADNALYAAKTAGRNRIMYSWPSGYDSRKTTPFSIH